MSMKYEHDSKLVAQAIVIKARNEAEKQRIIKKLQADPLYLATIREIETKRLNKGS